LFFMVKLKVHEPRQTSSGVDESGTNRDESAGRLGRIRGASESSAPCSATQATETRNHCMPTFATTAHDTGRPTSTRGRQREAQQSITQQECSAANRLRTATAA
jgi:hypothetical protein